VHSGKNRNQWWQRGLFI